ncbi:MAG: ROK family protein [Opitutales bacterium]
MLSLPSYTRPDLEPEFLPAAVWTRAFRELVATDGGARPFSFVISRPDGTGFVHETRVLGADHPAAALNCRHVERRLKFLLWQKGGSRVQVVGAPELAAQLAAAYHPSGARAFDHDFLGQRIYGAPFAVEAAAGLPEQPAEAAGLAVGRNLDGCRIGFDLGGSDRKAAALIDGRVVYSEEIAWQPYFETDPNYHLEGVHDSLRRAAAHLPRVDAIGGSAAGIYVNNEVRVASLFRGVDPDQFARHIRRMFFTLQERWHGVPFEVANDGEVTALAGSMALGENAVLGVSMGTSTAGGYVTPAGRITSWLNELCFVPVDYRADAPADEWSGDRGCGVQYFSQQAVARLADRAGFAFSPDLPFARRLELVQEAMAQGDPRAERIFHAIGTFYGHAIAHWAEFYEIRHLQTLGRVTTGAGGDLILRRAREVLAQDYPELAGSIRLSMPEEKQRRHGQAIAAASLPDRRHSVSLPPRTNP